MTMRETIDIQKRTFDFGVRIIKFVDRLPRTLAGMEVGRQVLRSGTSIGANMEEANGAKSKSDFIHKVCIAYKEARETRFWLATIQAAILPDSAEVAGLHKECDEIVRILFTIRKTARTSRRAPPY